MRKLPLPECRRVAARADRYRRRVIDRGDAPGRATFVAAVAAELFAWRAAHWTMQRAETVNEQVRIARDELDPARQQAADAKVAADAQEPAAERAERRLETSRLDAVAPEIFAVAFPTSLVYSEPSGGLRSDDPLDPDNE